MAKKSENTKKITEKLKLIDLSEGQLNEKIRETESKIMQHQLDKVRGKVKNLRQVFNWRKEIARMKTILNMKKIR